VIHTSSGIDVIRLLDRVAQYPDRYVELIICSPFIGDSLLQKLVHLAHRAHHAHCALRVVTSGSCASRIAGYFPGGSRSPVVERARLHAKVYVAIGRRHSDSEAIVTSANLTPGGTAHNVELGIRAISRTDEGRRLLAEVHYFVRRLAA
jgi:hypothetical protein